VREAVVRMTVAVLAPTPVGRAVRGRVAEGIDVGLVRDLVTPAP
jgi:hypothetical protein